MVPPKWGGLALRSPYQVFYKTRAPIPHLGATGGLPATPPRRRLGPGTAPSPSGSPRPASMQDVAWADIGQAPAYLKLAFKLSPANKRQRAQQRSISAPSLTVGCIRPSPFVRERRNGGVLHNWTASRQVGIMSQHWEGQVIMVLEFLAVAAAIAVVAFALGSVL